MINFWLLLFIIVLAFLVGGLAVHAYPSYDWKIGAVHDWMQKQVRAVTARFDAVRAWFTAKKSRV